MADPLDAPGPPGSTGTAGLPGDPPRGRPDPAVADVRRAVREALADVEPGETVLVACSGGADSTALAAATGFGSRAAGWQVAAVVVDHGLQPDSPEVSRQAAARLTTLGIAPVHVVPAGVATGPGAGGPEAAARAARYAALDRAAHDLSARCVLLGHTRDDQAETVLLGLSRGSGARSLSGMPPVSGLYRRPLLGLSRATTERACAAERIEVWHDPHNRDHGFTRVRVRERLLPMLEADLGPGVAEALARTARLLRDDADALDAFADAAREDCRIDTGALDTGALDTGALDTGALETGSLAALPPALRRRVLRLAALEAGCPATDLTAAHVDAVDALVTRWHGQRGVDLPGAVLAARAGGTLRFGPRPVGG